MKFYGKPNYLVSRTRRVRGRLSRKPLFRFDENGEYETDNPKLIKLLKRRFKHEKPDYSKMTYNELRRMADFSTYKMTKEDIIEKMEELDKKKRE